jgi:ElaB/YqjD/DUF883 family membrane-anchored ribosome-binding protein
MKMKKEECKQKVQEIRQKIDKSIQDNPYKAVVIGCAVGLGVGLLVGLSIRR